MAKKKNLFLNIFPGLRLGLITPLDLDETKAHPLLLILYGILHFCILFWFMFSNLWLKLFIKCVFSIGLNSDGTLGGQAVSDQFSLGWDTVLVSLHSVLVARLDGRGSGFQGQRIRHEIHQRLGTVDVKDQLAALQYVLCVIPPCNFLYLIWLIFSWTILSSGRSFLQVIPMQVRSLSM